MPRRVRTELKRLLELLNPSLKIFVADCLPLNLERVMGDSIIVQIPVSSSERERLLQFPHVSPLPADYVGDYGDVIVTQSLVILIVPDYILTNPSALFISDPCLGVWDVLYRWNRHRHFGACIRCGADGPVDFYCGVCGA